MNWLTSGQEHQECVNRPQRRIKKAALISSRLSHGETAAAITADDMRLQLNRLALEGRRDDCLALMQELGNWQSNDPSERKDVLFIPYLGNTKG